MLISFPIIPAGADTQDEDAKLQAVLAHELLDEGTFPVAIDTRWHGGIHMSTGGEPIRAIADGEVVCFRCADGVLNYPGQGDIDTDFILLKHSTETGKATPVVFYSLYMHLANRTTLIADQRKKLPKFWIDSKPNQSVQKPTATKVYRKDVLGYAGIVYNRTDVFHFEVFATDSDFSHFWKDSREITTHGSDDVFGDMHFIIPPNQSFAARHPSAPTSGVHQLDFDRTHKLPLPSGKQGNNTETLYVTIRLKAGNYHATSQVERNGVFVLLGQEVLIDGYEYELYRQSVFLYPDCPSAGYEWLRFGRVLGPDSTTTTQNFKAIRYSETDVGYIDLAQTGIKHLSNADFPHWQGWAKVEEGEMLSPADGICDVPALIDILKSADANADGKLTKEELAGYLGQDQNSVVRKKLRYMIVKNPTEWDDDEASIEARYGRLKGEGQPLHESDSWTAFISHVRNTTFWSKSGVNEKSVWHFHPLQFVNQFKTCAWYNAVELARIFPDSRYPLASLTTEARGRTPNSIRELNRVEINKIKEKYLINTPIRMAHFYGEGAVESFFLALMVEGSVSYSKNPKHASFQPETDDYYRPSKPTDYLFYLEGRLGNIEAGDGPKFRGRGIKQLTGRENYSKYWVFRGWLSASSFTSPWWNPSRPQRAPDIPDPQRLSNNPHNSIDAGGWYWTGGSASNGFRTINSVVGQSSIDRASVSAVARAINGINRDTGEPNALDQRLNETIAAAKIILDET